MAKKVYVTAAQKNAAQMVVKRNTAAGRFVAPSVRKIAEAETVLHPKGSASSALSRRLSPHAAEVRKATAEIKTAGFRRRRKK